MIDLAPIFLRNSAPGLVSEQPAPSGLRGWMVSGTYGVRLGAPSEIILDGINADAFFPHLFFDYMRFALASKESIHLSFDRTFDKRAAAWPLIKRYYSAFFSAHALLRAQGKGVTWIDAVEAQQLENVGKLYIGPNFALKKGGYAFSFETGNGFNAELKLARISYGGGSHDDFWRFFLGHLSDFGSELLRTGGPTAANAVSRFSELRQIILGQTGGVWLSFMRNEINYQHKFGTWFPFKSPPTGIAQDRRILQQQNSWVNLNVDAITQPLRAFNALTCCLASINSDFATLVKERAGVGANRFRAEWNRLQSSLGA